MKDLQHPVGKGFLFVSLIANLVLAIVLITVVQASQKENPTALETSRTKQWRSVIAQNCVYSGGEYEEAKDKCHCPSETETDMYNKETGYCETTHGGPGGEYGMLLMSTQAEIPETAGGTSVANEPPEGPINETTLPADIHPGQITKTVKGKFALVSRRNMNTPLMSVPSTFNTTFAGVLEWDESVKQWKKFLEIKDASIENANNPVDMWFEGPEGTDQMPFVQVKDQNGAGSGEGHVKTLRSDSIEHTSWTVTECFYHLDDAGRKNDVSLADAYCNNAKIAPAL